MKYECYYYKTWEEQKRQLANFSSNFLTANERYITTREILQKSSIFLDAKW